MCSMCTVHMRILTTVTIQLRIQLSISNALVVVTTVYDYTTSGLPDLTSSL